MVYYHVSPKPIKELYDVSKPDRLARKIGKPTGFWYAKEKSWLPVLDRVNGHGILNAMRMTLGNQEVIGINESRPNTEIKAASKEYILYEVNIPEGEKTTAIEEADKNKILIVNTGNLEQLYSDLFEPTLSYDAIANHLATYAFINLTEDYSFIKKYIDEIDAPEETEENKAWLDELDQGELTDAQAVYDWIEDSINKMIYKEGVKEKILSWPEVNKFILQKHWAHFWFTSGFAGVEFDASVLANTDDRFPFLHLIEIESGCLWKPSVLHVVLEEVGRISFNTGSNESFNVYVRQNNTVKQKRKGVKGGRRVTKAQYRSAVARHTRRKRTYRRSSYTRG